MQQVGKYQMGFYYEQLSIDQQMLYPIIASSISFYQTEICVDAVKRDVHKVMLAILYDNPEFFYWNANDSVYADGKLKLCYLTENKEDAILKLKTIRKKSQVLLSEFWEEGISQIDLLEKIYVYLTEHIQYAWYELQKPGLYPWIYDMSGVFLQESAVCLGIAQAIHYLCMKLHLPSVLITGDVFMSGLKMHHGWNLIEVNGSFFHIDLTYEICEPGSKKNYFLKESKDMKAYTWNQDVYPSGHA